MRIQLGPSTTTYKSLQCIALTPIVVTFYRCSHFQCILCEETPVIFGVLRFSHHFRHNFAQTFDLVYTTRCPIAPSSMQSSPRTTAFGQPWLVNWTANLFASTVVTLTSPALLHNQLQHPICTTRLVIPHSPNASLHPPDCRRFIVQIT